MNILELTDVKFAVDGRKILNGVSCGITSGETVGIIGPMEVVRQLCLIVSPVLTEVSKGRFHFKTRTLQITNLTSGR